MINKYYNINKSEYSMKLWMTRSKIKNFDPIQSDLYKNY